MSTAPTRPHYDHNGKRDGSCHPVPETINPVPPDDSEEDEAIAEADSFVEALWEIATKYNVPVTNNLPRWQDGVWLREIGAFIGEIQDAARRFKEEI